MKVLLLSLVLLFSQVGAAAATSREVSTCDGEWLAFILWKSAAGRPQLDKVLAEVPQATRIQIRAGDGRELRGLKLGSTAGPARGFVLVIQGNGWLVTTLAPYLRPFQDAGLDVFLYDFRGYGLSAGKSRIAPIVEDYKEILADLLAKSYAGKFVYAFSGGGVILLNSLTDLSKLDAAAIDAAPSRVALTCERNYDAVDHLPSACGNLVVLHGTLDKLISQEEISELAAKARTCGGQLDTAKARGHPFQDEAEDAKRTRVKELSSYFISRLPAGEKK